MGLLHLEFLLGTTVSPEIAQAWTRAGSRRRRRIVPNESDSRQSLEDRVQY